MSGTARGAAALVALVALASAPVARAATARAPDAARGAVTPAPDFAGRWTLDVAHSTFGTAASTPRGRSDEIARRGDTLAIRSLTVRAGGDTLRLAYRYLVNGESTNAVLGQTVRTSATLRGRTLTLASVTNLLALSLRVDERWTLAERGDTLTIERVSHSPLGEQRQRLVFARR